MQSKTTTKKPAVDTMETLRKNLAVELVDIIRCNPWRQGGKNPDERFERYSAEAAMTYGGIAALLKLEGKIDDQDFDEAFEIQRLAATRFTGFAPAANARGQDLIEQALLRFCHNTRLLRAKQQMLAFSA